MIRITVWQIDLWMMQDQNISKGGAGKKVMIFSDSRTNPSEEGEDDKNHGTTEFEPAHRELN